jgi:hypothetical protein
MDPDGNMVGTFVDEEDGRTRPTEEQVQGLIDEAVAEVSSQLGGNPCNERLVLRARTAAAQYAAMLVELSYFPEQVQSNRSPYAQIKELYDQGLKALAMSVSEECGGQGAGDGGAGNLPVFNFDQTVDPIGKDGPAW